MSAEILKTVDFMGKAFLHIWPYLLVTIPLAVVVNMSGASKYIKRAFDAGPITAILLATRFQLCRSRDCNIARFFIRLFKPFFDDLGIRHHKPLGLLSGYSK